MTTVFQRIAALAIQSPTSLRGLTRLEVVIGPPGAGKTTLVRERKSPGDAVVDTDLLADAMGAEPQKGPMMPAVWAARDAAMYALATEVALPRAWVVACAPTRWERLHAAKPFHRARLTVLETPPGECLRRIRAQGRTGMTDWQVLVEEWWTRYKRPGQDEGWADVEVIG